MIPDSELFLLTTIKEEPREIITLTCMAYAVNEGVHDKLTPYSRATLTQWMHHRTKPMHLLNTAVLTDVQLVEKYKEMLPYAVVQAHEDSKMCDLRRLKKLAEELNFFLYIPDILIRRGEQNA